MNIDLPTLTQLNQWLQICCDCGDRLVLGQKINTAFACWIPRVLNLPFGRSNADLREIELLYFRNTVQASLPNVCLKHSSLTCGAAETLW